MFFRKTDESFWTWANNWNTNDHSVLNVAPGVTLVNVNAQDQQGYRNVAQFDHGLGFKVGIRTDGTFRIWAEQRLDKERQRNSFYEWFSTDKQIGDQTNWVAVASDGHKIVTLKDDGSLWLWNFSYDYRRGWGLSFFENDILSMRPVRLGTHSDWIAVSGGQGNVCALAADGSLWYWPLERSEDFYNNYNNSWSLPLLDISHKPQFLANVFSQPE
jgi:alpha-tubulin suppressor-like RCC1 family protein